MPKGRSPFASSNNLRGVCIAFADGSVKFVTDGISGNVYAALFSPSSSILDQTALRQVIPSADEF